MESIGAGDQAGANEVVRDTIRLDREEIGLKWAGRQRSNPTSPSMKLRLLGSPERLLIYCVVDHRTIQRQSASCTLPLAYLGKIFRSLADAVLGDGERGDDGLPGQDHHAEGGPYRNEYETGSCIATMTSIWSTFNRL